MDGHGPSGRSVAVVTGVSRQIGIGAAIARALAADGWDIGSVSWRPYDERMPWGDRDEDSAEIDRELRSLGAMTAMVEADLGRVDAAEEILTAIGAELGPVTALVLCHCESVESGILDTTVEAFDQHMAVNARATWLLVRSFAQRFRGAPGTGRIVALTSDHTVRNLPYGASKGAMDRIVLAAAVELAELGVTANVVNPGATDTGWMDSDVLAEVARTTLAGRVGQPEDCANLVAFLCSPRGGWVNGQLLASNGGLG